MKTLWRSVALVGLCFSLALADGLGVAQLGKEAGKIRQLSYRTVPSKVLTQKQAAAYVLKLLDKELEPRLTLARETYLKQLGLMPAGSTIKGILSKLYAGQVRGLYDPTKKQYVVVKESQGSSMDAAAAMAGLNLTDIYTVHELGHAIQDQHFNLSKISKMVAKDGDRSMAAHALIEGDASVVMMEYMLAQSGLAGQGFDLESLGLGGSPDLQGLGLEGMGLEGMGLDAPGGLGLTDPALAAAPLYFQESLQAPYNQGMVFVSALKKQGGWAAVNQAFRRLPRSSEEVYHPEKYLRRNDPPKTVSLNSYPAKIGSYKSLGEDTAGEFTVRILCQESRQSMAAAAGWGGDRYRTYHNGKDGFVVWNTVWDSRQDAIEFAKLMKIVLGRRGKPAGVGTWKNGSRRYTMKLTGNRVDMVLGAPSGVKL